MQREQIQVLDKGSLRSISGERTRIAVFLLTLFLIVGAAAGMVAPYALAVFTGALLALLSYPVFLGLRRHRIGSKPAALLVTLGVLLLVVAPVSAFVFMTIKQAIETGRALGDDEMTYVRSLLERLGRWEPLRVLIGDPQAIERQARLLAQSLGKSASAAVLSVASNVPEALLQAALASIAFYYFLLDGRRFTGWMAERIPMSPDARVRVVESFKNTTVSTIWATLAAAAAQSSVMLTAFLVLGVPAATLAAGATFILAWIPLLGSTPVWLGGALYLYTQGSIIKVILMIAFGLVTGVVDNLVRPIVLKGRGNMHPLVSLVSIFGGVWVFGILGVFLGPILSAVAISLLEIWPEIGRRYGLIR